MAGDGAGVEPGGAGTAPAPHPAPTPLDGVVEFRGVLATIDGDGLSDRERVDLVAELERVKGALAAAQARVTHALRLSREAASPQDAVRSVGSEVALARRCSPTLGDRFVGLARAVVTEMPQTHAALTEGVCSERHVVFLVQATSVLSVDDRREVDRRVGPLLGRLGVKAAERAARRVAAELDAAAVVRRMEEAVRSRRVSVRPAPDGMAYLTVLGPLVEVVGAHAALRARAASVVGGQCPVEPPAGRAVGAIAADTALRLLSGRMPDGLVQPVEVHLVMTDRALFGTGDPSRSEHEPARIPGHGSLPAPVARAWLRAADSTPAESTRPASTTPDPHVPGGQSDGPEATRSAQAETSVGGDLTSVWLRRLYTSPDGRDLVAMDSRRRAFSGLLRRMLVLRDDVCTTPWCESPVAHADHADPARGGGPTSFTNGRGTCVRCNHVKEAPGWSARVSADTTGGSGEQAGSGDGGRAQARLDPDREAALGPPGSGGAPARLAPGVTPPRLASDRLSPDGGLGRTVSVTTPSGFTVSSHPPPLLGWGSHAVEEAGSAEAAGSAGSAGTAGSFEAVQPDGAAESVTALEAVQPNGAAESGVTLEAEGTARAAARHPTAQAHGRRPVRRGRRRGAERRAPAPRRPRLTSRLERELCRYLR